MKRALCAALLLLSACYTPTQKVTLRVELPLELAEHAKALKVLPAIAEARREVGNGVTVLELKRAALHVRLVLPGACPKRVDLQQLAADEPGEVQLDPLFDTGPSERVIGLGQTFELRARPSCAEATAARTAFTVSGGAGLEHIEATRDGRSFRATTGKVGPAVRVESGIVAVSARAQRELRSEVVFRVELDGQRFERRLGIAAVARASGLADVGLGHPVLLAGEGWTLLEKPPASRAELRRVGSLFELLPDQTGQYRVARADGETLSLHGGRYDQMPLDCGRSDCHAELSRSSATSPMTQVLASDLGGCHSLTDPACASACHTTGEPGTADGGFTQVAAELELSMLPTEYDALPRALRRLGGVGCLACHGPTKIPEPSQRFQLMSNDVCAVCHDAPPRYGHVQALLASRMGHSDNAAATREPACARCHTAWGAVGRPAPPTGKVFGISCATCHDVHPHGPQSAAPSPGAPNEPSHAGLLRSFALPASLPDPPASFRGVSQVCVACHAPGSNVGRPEASAAALVAGRGGLEPETGQPLGLDGPHATAARGCLSCHDSGPEALLLGKSHAFRATPQVCGRCHDHAMQRDPTIARRARRLLARLAPELGADGASAPWHANQRQPAAGSAPRERALRNVLLVLEDPAADVHHPSYARALLDAAERLGAKP